MSMSMAQGYTEVCKARTSPSIKILYSFFDQSSLVKDDRTPPMVVYAGSSLTLTE